MAVVGLVYLILTAVALTAWLFLADPAQIPSLMGSYLFPYPYAIQAFGDAVCAWLGILQALVFFSLVNAVRKRKLKNTGANLLASIMAGAWFVSVSFVVVVAYVH